MDRKIVIIPTYNEKENIEKIIRAVFSLEGGFHILVIEDGSPDGTAAIVKTLQEEFPERLFMIERKGKLGLGTAYITGFKWSVEQKYDYIFEMDGVQRDRATGRSYPGSCPRCCRLSCSSVPCPSPSVSRSSEPGS